MRLRDWPPRRIGRLWLAGFAAEALLIAVLRLSSEPGMPPMPQPRLREVDSVVAADTPSSAERRQALADAGFTIDLQPLASGDTLVRIGRDSSFVALSLRGDTVRVADASVDVQQAIGSITTAFVGAMDRIVMLMLILAAVLLTVPILLVSITLTWAIQRRRA